MYKEIPKSDSFVNKAVFSGNPRWSTKVFLRIHQGKLGIHHEEKPGLQHLLRNLSEEKKGLFPCAQTSYFASAVLRSSNHLPLILFVCVGAVASTLDFGGRRPGRASGGDSLSTSRVVPLTDP